MNRYLPIVLLLHTLIFTVSVKTAHAAVTVTPASGLCLNIAPGAFTGIGNIIIDENNDADFAVGAFMTLILSAPAGFAFQAGTGTVSYTGSRNITAASIVVAAGTITVTFSTGGTNRDDRMTISGILARSTLAGSAGNILRTGGTATISGDATGGGINHGTLTSSNTGITITSAAAGNWGNGATWAGGVVPSCNANVVIIHNVNGTVNASVNNLTINTGGNLTANNAVTVAGTFTLAGSGSYIHNNGANASSTIFAGAESFSPTSTITIEIWYNTGVPFPTNVAGNFGNITFSEGNGWSQDGLFSPARIKGTLSVNSGQITMDDGTGMTTALTLQDVVINGTGVLRMATGTNRNLTLVSGNYIDTRVGGSSYSGIQFNCAGSVSWTVNGNVTINPNWSYFEGTGTTSGNSNITVNGDFNVTGGLFDFNRNVDAPLTIVVTGNTTISGNPGWVRFLDRNDEALNFTTTNFYINGGTNSTFLGGTAPTGPATFNILNDFILNGVSTGATLVNNGGNPSTTTLNVGRDLIVNSSDLYFANSNGAINVNVGRNITVDGSNGDLFGQVRVGTTSAVNVDVVGTVQINNGDFYISFGLGNITLDVVENLIINNGRFNGINNLTSANNGSATLTVNDIDFNGGTFHLVNSIISDGKTVQVNCNNDMLVDFMNTTDVFTFIGIANATNNAILDVNIGNNLTISGNFPGSYFLSSASTGNETFDIAGNMTINAGDVFFVGNESTLINNHNIVTNINGDLLITGGTTRLSTGAGVADINIGGSVSISGGLLNLKYNTGVATMDIAGSYTQSSGTFNLHSNTATTPDQITVNVNGNFLMSGGTMNFDNFATGAGLAEHRVNILGSSYSLGGNAIITHANNLSTNFIFGQIHFGYAGTTSYNRYSSTNEIRHVKYTINAGTYVDATASGNGFQMTSVGSSTSANHNSLTILGTLDMGSAILSARQNGAYYSRVTVGSGGRYRTSHTGGLYSGDNLVPCSLYGYVTTFNRVTYTLDPNSIVEYYGIATTVITGIPNGIAIGNNQKYGILEINFTGAAGTTWVYPEAADEVFIRTTLVLTNGEFNLDNDHVTNTGGRPITLENGSNISRTNGFIRSETEDASAMVKWTINSNSSHTLPFGYDAANYIPFTFQQTSGAAGVVSLATYRTAANNTPLPATVTHVRDVSGNDNAAATVDRFWHITTTGVANANLRFTYVPSEGTGIAAPRAQLWEPVTLGWFPPVAGQSNPTGNSTLAGSFSGFNTWWTLAAGSSPLPIELISFDVKKSGNEVDINWITASEINNNYFTILRSDNGINFETIEIVDGAGNSNSPIAYSTTDKAPLTGKNYYRLKQTDFDGKCTYSEIKSVFFGKAGLYSVFPNPVNSSSEFFVNVPANGEYSVSIFEITGKIVYKQIYTVNENKEIDLQPENLSLGSGMYHIKVMGPDESFTQKLIIQ